jgi:hypothetical protein
MTTAILAASYLSASLLAMLVPIATVVAIVAWGLRLIRHHERRRVSAGAGDRSPGGAGAAERSSSTGTG